MTLARLRWALTQLAIPCKKKLSRERKVPRSLVAETSTCKMQTAIVSKGESVSFLALSARS